MVRSLILLLTQRLREPLEELLTCMSEHTDYCEAIVEGSLC